MVQQVASCSSITSVVAGPLLLQPCLKTLDHAIVELNGGVVPYLNSRLFDRVKSADLLVEGVFVASVQCSQEVAVGGLDCTSEGMECIALVNAMTTTKAFGIRLLDGERRPASPCC